VGFCAASVVIKIPLKAPLFVGGDSDGMRPPRQAHDILQRSKAVAGWSMMKISPIWAGAFTVLLLGAAAPVLAQDRAARIDALKTGVLGAASATQFLTGRCGALHLAAPASVRAENSASAKAIVPADVRALLRVDEAAPVRHRHVRLTCGGHLLSEADNWYVPARLTPAMNHTLDTTDTPFGAVVRPLNFHRKTVAATPQQGPTVLQVKAVLLTPQGAPISLVVENYSGVLIGDR
jgi:hypothetical protein